MTVRALGTCGVCHAPVWSTVDGHSSSAPRWAGAPGRPLEIHPDCRYFQEAVQRARAAAERIVARPGSRWRTAESLKAQARYELERLEPVRSGAEPLPWQEDQCATSC